MVAPLPETLTLLGLLNTGFAGAGSSAPAVAPVRAAVEAIAVAARDTPKRAKERMHISVHSRNDDRMIA